MKQPPCYCGQPDCKRCQSRVRAVAWRRARRALARRPEVQRIRAEGRRAEVKQKRNPPETSIDKWDAISPFAGLAGAGQLRCVRYPIPRLD